MEFRCFVFAINWSDSNACSQGELHVHIEEMLHRIAKAAAKA
jgi:hypothetical protein